MSGEQPSAGRSGPFRLADDFEPTSIPDESIPLLTPFQRYMLEGMQRLFVAQGEFTGALASMKASVEEMAPQVKRLEADAALLKKVLSYGKFIAFGLVTRYFPEFAASIVKHAPAVLEAAGKAAAP